MVMYGHDSDAMQWGMRLFDGDPSFYNGYYGDVFRTDHESYHGHYNGDHYDISDCSHVENDEIIARTLQEDFSRLAMSEEASGYSHNGEEQLTTSVDAEDWHYTTSRNYYSGRVMR